MGSYVWPCPDYTRITSGYGQRSDGFHGAIDLGCASGRPILATRSGTVTTSTYQSSYGNYIMIDHGAGIVSLYAHASKLLVSKGKTVTAGEKIALVGSTGNSTGPHLHFEIRVNGTKKNPQNYVSDKDTVAAYTGTAAAAGTAAVVAGVAAAGIASAATSSTDEETTTQETTSKEITDVVVKSTTGSTGAFRYTALRSTDAILASGCELLIQETDTTIHMPVVEGEISLEYERKSSPGVLTFNVLKEGSLSFHEGNPVSFRVDGKRIFYGYVFTKKRNKDGIITVTCYDQLRYFKNKDTMVYKDKTYSELLKTVSDSYKLTTGTIEDTKYKIAGRIEEGTIFDILGNAADETVLNTGELYVLYDDCGAICLKNIKNMLVPILIDRDTAENYDYTSSIDESTYDRIVLARDNSDTGERELYIVNDEGKQSYWGILQHYENTGSVGSTGSTGSSSTSSSSSDTATTGMSTETRTMSQTGIDFVKDYEKLILYTYDDGYGTATIGYGHTGSDVYWGQRITEAQAEAYLKADIAQFETVVNTKVTVPITQNMFDAMVSLSFNIGGGAFGGSTLLQLLNQGDYTGAADQFPLWRMAGGQVSPGLEKRRAKERQLFLTGYSAGSTTAATATATTSSTSESTTSASSIPDATVLEEKAKVLLEYYNKKTRNLQIKGCFGDDRVRGGSTVAVNMDIGDLIVSNYMVVERVKHHFNHMVHTMDLTVVGIRGEFIA